jgi:SAM-dependent methyltransferase
LEINKDKQVSFDDYVETYQKVVQSSIDFIGQDVDFFIELKANILVDIAKEYFFDVDKIKVLDIGSGIGLTDGYLSNKIKNLYGIDVEEGIVNKAKTRNPSVTYSQYDGLKLPFGNSEFDITLAINVMHHVNPSNWENFASEMYRVVKQGGLAVLFEHNPYNPLTKLAVSKCEFDRDAVLLKKGRLKKIFSSAGFRIKKGSYIVFFPFKNKFFRIIEKGLAWLFLGAQYYIISKKEA